MRSVFVTGEFTGIGWAGAKLLLDLRQCARQDHREAPRRDTTGMTATR